jgi:hypothetical protein
VGRSPLQVESGLLHLLASANMPEGGPATGIACKGPRGVNRSMPAFQRATKAAEHAPFAAAYRLCHPGITTRLPFSSSTSSNGTQTVMQRSPS